MGHPDQIKDRIANIEQIEEVVVAMRGIAAAHSADASRHLRAIREHAATVARAMSEALALLGPDRHAPPERAAPHLAVVVGAAQGFTGTFNESIVSAVLERPGKDATRQFLLVGQRTASEFELRGHPPVWWAPMVARAAEVPALASRIVDVLFDRVGRGEAGRVSLTYAAPGDAGRSLAERRLLPFAPGRIARSTGVVRPLVTLPPPRLVARLIEEYVFTEVCEALMLGFAAENEARMAAMTRARSNVRRIGTDLRQEYHQARQEETTTEILELAAFSLLR